MKQKLIAIAGPTASGKTSLSVELALRLNGEVISADSMQVYRHMDIGTAKVTKEEAKGIPHHLIDILDPEEEWNVMLFQQKAKEAIADISSRGKIPILCGGTGFYVHALLYDTDFAEEEGDELRESLEREMEEQGPEAMHARLLQVDPESAAAIHPNNRKRVIRALEYYMMHGRPISRHNAEQHERSSPYDFLLFGIDMDRAVLYDRIERRVDQMMEEGLVQEVQDLLAQGIRPGMTSMQGLGYKEMIPYLEGKEELEESVRVLKRDTRHFAKRQLTWFRKEKDMIWLRADDPNESLVSQALRYIPKTFAEGPLILK